MKNKLLLLAISLAFNTQIILAQVPSNIPTNGLIGYWPFNGNANDESGNGNNGKVFGAVLSTDRFGNENKSYFFSGKDWIEINSLSQINNSKELSISIWVKSTGLNSSPSYGDGGSQYYFSRGDFGNNGFVMSTIQGSSPHFSGTIHSPSMFDNPRIIGIEVNSPVKFNIPHTQWHHLLMIYNGVSVNYYVDGVLSVSSKYDKNIGVSTSPSVFGKQFYLNDECYVVGMIDDAAIWNRALTDEEIGNLFSFDSNKISNVINSSTNNNLNSEKPDKNTISISKDLENKGTLQTDISKNYLDYQKNVNYKPILGYMISVNGCKVSRVNPDVNSVTWSGLCKDSLANGNGILKYYTSEKETFSYEGDVLNGIFYGYGKCTYTNGDKYEGEFKDNKSNGQGKFTWKNGDEYVGKWKDGKSNGSGKLTYTNGAIYDGEWLEDIKNGQGTMIYPNGDKYVGELRNNKKNGIGTQTYSNGSIYEGEWKDNIFNGHGKYTNIYGTYVGEFKNDLYHGQGTMTFINGGKYVGEWKDGYYNGQGTLTYQNGKKQSGVWKDSELVKSSINVEERKDIGRRTFEEEFRYQLLNSKTVVCPKCRGDRSKKYVCPKCNEKGLIICYECNGRGQKYNGRLCHRCNGNMRIPCTQCNATGKTKCSRCGGIGTIQVPK